MNKWITHLTFGFSFDARIKSRIDMNTFAEAMGYKPLYLFTMDFDWEEAGPLHSRIDGITAAVGAGDLIVYQYPSLLGEKFDAEFIYRLKYRGARIAVFIHDPTQLSDGNFGFDEVSLFNATDLLIAHGARMENWLREAGITVPIINRIVYDYVVDAGDAVLTDKLERKVVFAGALGKSPYINDWQLHTELAAFCKKPEPGEATANDKVDFRGRFNQEELIRLMPKDRFGIAWDTISNFRGDYTKYNAPGKLGLYLALGLPLIVWDQSAAAVEVVNKYELGYALPSIEEIDPLMDRLTDEDLAALKQRVNQFSKPIREGFFLRKSLVEAEEVILTQSY